MKRYDYAFDITTGAARSTLSIDVLEPGGDCFAAEYVPTVVDNPVWNGEPAASATIDAGAITFCAAEGGGVAAKEPLSIASGVVVKQKTFFGLDIGFSKHTDLAGGKLSYLLSWVGGCDRFGPCDDDPSQLAEFHYEITHPSGSIVLCPGVLTKGDTLTKCDIQGTLAPTYSAFAVAEDPLWKATPFGSAAGVDIVLYEVPNGGIGAALEQPVVLDFMDWITDLLGPFPYGSELRVAGGPTQWLGFEHPANIILQEHLPEQLGAYLNPTLHVLMHEIIHQWSGDRTTLATAQDFVWKEATAEYLAYVYEDERRPPGEAAATLEYWDDISLFASYHPRPTDDPPPAVEAFYGDVYGPGPMTLYVQLESILGRQVVLDGIKDFLSQPGARNVHNLRASLSAAAGTKELELYFDAWVFGKGAPEWPSFVVETVQQAGEVTITVTQQNTSGLIYGCAVDVEVAGATTKARATVNFGLAPSNPKAVATVPLAEPLVSYTLDPDHRVIGKDITAKPAAPPPKRKIYIL